MKRWFALPIAILIVAAVILSMVRPTNAFSQQEENLDELIDTEASASEKETLQHVPKIVKIKYVIEESQPPNLLVTAYGQVPTGGWMQTQLLRRIYITPPSDGIWEYDMIGLPPSDPATTVVTTLRAKDTWEDYDQSIKGVRVYGIGRGVKEIRFSKK